MIILQIIKAKVSPIYIPINLKTRITHMISNAWSNSPIHTIDFISRIGSGGEEYNLNREMLLFLSILRRIIN